MTSDRQRQFGKWGMLLWFWGGMVSILLGVIRQSGPFAWAVEAQERLFSTHDVIAAVLPTMAVLMAPVFIADTRRFRQGSPFRQGLAAGVDAMTKPNGGVTADTPDPRGVLLRQARLLFALAAVATTVGLVLAWRVTAPPHTGEPLPTLDLHAATDPRRHLPPFVRIVGASPGVPVWSNDSTFRNDRYHEVYIPLVKPGWRPGEPVLLLVYREFIRSRGQPPARNTGLGAIEGSLRRDAVPAWKLDAMRRAGLNVGSDTTVLELKPLAGRVPGIDLTQRVLPLLLAGAVAAALLVAGWQTLRRRETFE